MKSSIDKKFKNIVVLYVEDEENIRKKISDTLKYYVKEVIQAKDGSEGFEKYKKYSPDIILSDVLMPNMNGIEMVQKIRQINPKIPISLISAHTDKELLLHAVTLHLEDYLIKPVTLEHILHTIEKSLKKIDKSYSPLCNVFQDFQYDIDKKILSNESTTIKLSKKEIDFLELLLKNEHRIVTYQELQEYVWQDEVMTDNALRSLVFSLRNKLPTNIIKNLSGIGYKIDI